MEKYINEAGKECWRGVTLESGFSADIFHGLPMNNDTNFSYDDNYQWAFHSELGSLTVLDRRTGFGWRDIETGYRSQEGKFWLASGDIDVRESGCATVGEAIEWIKDRANTCVGD